MAVLPKMDLALLTGCSFVKWAVPILCQSARATAVHSFPHLRCSLRKEVRYDETPSSYMTPLAGVSGCVRLARPSKEARRAKEKDRRRTAAAAHFA